MMAPFGCQCSGAADEFRVEWKPPVREVRLDFGLPLEEMEFDAQAEDGYNISFGDNVATPWEPLGWSDLAFVLPGESAAGTCHTAAPMKVQTSPTNLMIPAELHPSDDGAVEFVARITRTQGELIGLDTVGRRQPPALRITTVRPGLIEQWNEQNPDLQVKPHDLIVQVNGHGDSVASMYAAISKSKTLVMVIRRSSRK